VEDWGQGKVQTKEKVGHIKSPDDDMSEVLEACPLGYSLAKVVSVIAGNEFNFINLQVAH